VDENFFTGIIFGNENYLPILIKISTINKDENNYRYFTEHYKRRKKCLDL